MRTIHLKESRYSHESKGAVFSRFAEQLCCNFGVKARYAYWASALLLLEKRITEAFFADCRGVSMAWKHSGLVW
jgi:hypothetical protein